MDADIQYVTFAHGDGHDAVSDKSLWAFINKTMATTTQAVAKNGQGPGKLISRFLNLEHRFQVVTGHRPQERLGFNCNSAHRSPTKDLARHRSSHTFRLSAGLRNR